MSILSIGSLNLDYVFQTPHFVLPGETLTATGMGVNPGGKGLNQSIALARAGATVCHAGCIGHQGSSLIDLLAENGVDVSLVQEVNEPQGTAFIQVNDAGENCIVIFGGSNRALTEARVEELLDEASPIDMVVLQNEISSLGHILSECSRRAIPVMLNPAPYTPDVASMDLSCVSWLIVNEVEVEQLTGTADPDKAWEIIHARWPQAGLVITLGEQGSICFSKDARLEQAAFKVDTVDTTAAGDTFIGFFVAGLQEGLTLSDCLRRASLASAVAVTRPGAAPSIPWRSELEGNPAW